MNLHSDSVSKKGEGDGGNLIQAAGASLASDHIHAVFGDREAASSPSNHIPSIRNLALCTSNSYCRTCDSLKVDET